MRYFALFIGFFLLCQSTARAQESISGFIVNGIDGVGISLSDRFGVSFGADEHFVNLLDCANYLGLSTPDVCDTSITIEDETDSDAGSDADDVDAADTADVTTEDSQGTDTTVEDSTEDTSEQSDSADPPDTIDDTEVPPEEDTAVDDVEDGGASKPGKADDPGAPGSFVITLSTDSYSNAEFGVAVGTSCSTTEFPSGDTGTCLPIMALASRTDYTDIDVTVSMTDLLGEDCSIGGTSILYFYVHDSDSDVLYVSQATFEMDYTFPEAPTVSSIEAGEKNLYIIWSDSDNTNETDLTYTVYYSKLEFTSADIDSGEVEIKSVSGLTATTYQLLELENYVLYYVGVVAVDGASNKSVLCDVSDLSEGTPIEVDDFYEYYKKVGGKEEGGFTGCFVATAAWNSPMAPAVTHLRSFRDDYLQSNEGGKTLIALYETVGPNAAEIIYDNGWLKPIARFFLLPLLLFVLLWATGNLWIPIVLAGMWAVRRFNRRRAKQRSA